MDGGRDSVVGEAARFVRLEAGCCCCNLSCF